MGRKRRDRGDGTIFYEEDRRRWVGILDLGLDGDGRRRRTKVVGTNRDAVKVKLASLREARGLGLDVEARTTTFAQLADLWLERGLPSEITTNTRDNYRILLQGRVAKALGRKRVTELRSTDIEAMLLELKQLGRSARYMRLALNLTRRVLDYGMRRDVVKRNVADRIHAPDGPTATRTGLSPDEARRLLDACAGHRLGGLVSLSLLLGLRPGEAAGLTWEHVDLTSDEATLTVAASLRRDRSSRLVLVPPKTPSSRRTLALPDGAVALLARQRREQDAEAATRAGWSNQVGLVFTNETGGALDPSNVRRALARIANDAGLTHVHPHMLRHAAASLMSAAGVHLEDIADTLGHRSVTVTADVYRHPIGAVRRGHLGALISLREV